MSEVFFHGSSKLFTKFNLDYALKGTGKIKFGFGVYITSSFASAANYSKTSDAADDEKHYVYTVEVVEKNRTNYISFIEEVCPIIIAKAEAKLGDKIPPVYTVNGNLFRKYIGIRLTHDVKEWQKLALATDPEKVKLKVGIIEEKAASEFLYGIGVKMIEWPYTWTSGETRFNRAILKADSIKIIKIEEVKLDSKGKYIEGSNTLVKDLSGKPRSLAPFIKEYYPEYWGVKDYPVKECVSIHKVDGYWGIFSNFAQTPLIVKGVKFKTSEQLFQVLKFKKAEHVKEVYNAPQPKMIAKKLETLNRRADWGMIFIDVMKFCLQTKYEQSKAFFSKLEESKGKYIVEDQNTFKKPADAWGVKLELVNKSDSEQRFAGPNLLGQLLMELRDNGTLKYSLPDDIFDCLDYLK